MIELTDDGIARATQNPRLTPRVEGIIMNCLGKTCKFRFRSLSTPNRRFSQSRPIPPPPQDWTGSVAFICLSLHEARLLCCPPRLQNGSTVQMVRHGPTRRTTCGCLCNRSASVVTMNARVRGFGTRVGPKVVVEHARLCCQEGPPCRHGAGRPVQSAGVCLKGGRP